MKQLNEDIAEMFLTDGMLKVTKATQSHESFKKLGGNFKISSNITKTATTNGIVRFLMISMMNLIAT